MHTRYAHSRGHGHMHATPMLARGRGSLGSARVRPVRGGLFTVNSPTCTQPLHTRTRCSGSTVRSLFTLARPQPVHTRPSTASPLWARLHTQVAKQHSLEVALSQPPRAQSIVSTLCTGILHGCSGSGHLLGVMPALTMPSWRIATTYLVAFGLGTMIAMSIFTGIVGELSSRMSTALDDPRTPGRLALGSSVFALLMGSLWTGKAVTTLGLPQMLPRLLGRTAALISA